MVALGGLSPQTRGRVQETVLKAKLPFSETSHHPPRWRPSPPSSLRSPHTAHRSTAQLPLPPIPAPGTRWPCLEMPPHIPFLHCCLSRPRVKDDVDRGPDNPHGETEFTHERIRDTSVFSVPSIGWLCQRHYGWFNQLGPRRGCGRWSATR